MFKSKGQKEVEIDKLLDVININKSSLDEYLNLANYLQIYHGGTMIPMFKKQKEKLYLQTLSHFCVNEINNSHM